MNFYFNTPERVAALTAEAMTWLGTPWCANSAGRQCGVACHNLPREIYIGSGFLTKAFPKLVGDPNASRFTRISAMETFLDTRAEFQRIGDDQTSVVPLLQPGDLVGVRVNPRCVNHLGVVVEGGDFIHVMMMKKTGLDPVALEPWSQQITAAWRPLELPT